MDTATPPTTPTVRAAATDTAAVEGRTVTLVYFAWVRERTGRDREQRVVPADVVTVADLIAHLATLGPDYAAAFGRPGIVRAALDHVHARPDAAIGAAREIAFFPPVTGG